MKGRLIIIEGIDGSGGTTQSNILYKNLKKKYKKVILTKEPQNKDITNLIKKVKDPVADLFLFLADRFLQYKNLKKFLDKGYIVISDRSYPSTYAYQFYYGGLRKIFNEEIIKKLDKISRNNIEPDLVIILDIDPKIAVKRLKNKDKKSRVRKFEKIEILNIVRRGYLYYGKKFGWKIIDGSKDIFSINREILENLERILK
ncbi:MAG: dTMP kinase [Minisyncoccia bacterium]